MSHLFEKSVKFPGRCDCCGMKPGNPIHASTVPFVYPAQPVLYEKAK